MNSSGGVVTHVTQFDTGRRKTRRMETGRENTIVETETNIFTINQISDTTIQGERGGMGQKTTDPNLLSISSKTAFRDLRGLQGTDNLRKVEHPVPFWGKTGSKKLS